MLGHEIGHVTARHSVQQISKAQLATLGLGVGSILSSDIAQFAGLASQGLGLLFLKYGRDAENQADELGFKYALEPELRRAGDGDVFQTLGRGRRAGRRRRPAPGVALDAPQSRRTGWPRPRPRLDTLHRDLASSDPQRTGRTCSESRGITYGDDPRQGFFEGNTFYHPDLRFQLEFPEGWQTQNTPQAVVAREPEAGRDDPARARRQGVARAGGAAVPVAGGGAGGAGLHLEHERQSRPPRATSRPRPSRARSRGSSRSFPTADAPTGCMGYTAAGQAQQLRRRRSARRSAASAQLRNQAALNVKPNRIEVVKLPREMTLAAVQPAVPVTIPIEELAIINQVDGPESVIPAGRMMKRVTGGNVPEQERPSGS